MKTCTDCKETLSVDEFYRHPTSKDGLNCYCKGCVKARTKVWRKKNPDKFRRQIALKVQRYNARLRSEALHVLGEVCMNCGFRDARALQIDHPEGGGRQERLVLSNTGFLLKVIANPTDYALLCANCNWIKRYERKEFGKRKYEDEVG